MSRASARRLVADGYGLAVATVLFVCLHNAGRSQVSAALFERAAEGRHSASSAGTTPAEHVHPEVVDAMRELGIDLADRVPRRLTRDEIAGRVARLIAELDDDAR